MAARASQITSSLLNDLLMLRKDIPFIPLEAGRGMSAETCGLDDVSLPDGLGSGPFTPFIIYLPYIIAALLSN